MKLKSRPHTLGLILILWSVHVQIIRCVQYRKRLRKNRLSKEQLKRIPTHRFRKGKKFHSDCHDEFKKSSFSC